MDRKYIKALKKFSAFYLIVFILLTVITINILDIPHWKDLSVDSITNVKQSLRIYDRNNQLVSFLNAGENRTKISIANLPEYVKYAFISAEDARFYEHDGIDVKRIVGATLADIKAGYYKEGASTITQQLIKNSQLNNDKKMSRKLQEALLAYQLEQRYSKDEILEMYLNFVYFGNRAYGIESASTTYFNKHAKELTLAEAALLAGVLKSPSKYAPHIHKESAVKRRNLVLSLMKSYGHISQEQYDISVKELLVLNQNAAYEYTCGFYMDMILRDASKLLKIDIENVLSGGYSIYSSLDAQLQSACENLYKDASLFPKDNKDGQKVQSALVVLDNKTNGIIAVIGGRTYDTRLGLNRATSMLRSPGSAIKPIMVYGPAFEERLLTPATVLSDERMSFGGYTPTNFGDKYNGNVTVREALVKSLNIPAVKALELVGIDKAKTYAQRLGITFDIKDNNLALALGGFTYGVSPLQLADAYSALANEGYYTPSSSIVKIVDADGNIVYSVSKNKECVFSKETAFLLSDILCDAAKNTAVSHFYTFPYQVALKTGTVGFNGTDGYMDAWAASYTPDYTVITWNGYDKTDASHYLPKGITGSSYPSLLARKVYEELYKNKAAAAFTAPEGIVALDIDKRALYTEGTVSVATDYTPDYYKLNEYFNRNYLPGTSSEYWCIPIPPEDITCMINEIRQPVISFRIKNEYVKYLIYRTSGNGQTDSVQNSSNAQMLTQLSGIAGNTVSYIDTSAAAGETYQYFIIPVHMEVYKNGSPLTGTSSKYVTVQLPS